MILKKLIPAINTLENIDRYECLSYEVKMVIPPYNAEGEEFLGLEKPLSFFMVRSDQDKAFFSYSYDKSKSTKLSSTSKKSLPNKFSGTCFKKHLEFLVEK